MKLEELTEDYPELLFCDGFDKAILGIAERINFGPVIVYSYEKIIEVLMKRDKMTKEEAIEFFDFNIGGAYVGENMPIFMKRIF